jgi:hypothetical protein
MDTEFCGTSVSPAEVVARFRPGKPVEVFVNPERPTQSVLISGVADPFNLYGLAGSLVVLALSLVALLKSKSYGAA